MGFLRRNLALAPRHTKEVAYKTLVRPQLEYVTPIWNPYHKLQIQEVEKVQRKAARWTCRRWRNTSSVGDMLDELEWPSLEARREEGSKSHCRAAPAVPSPIWCPSNLIFIISSKLTYEVKNCNDIMFLC